VQTDLQAIREMVNGANLTARVQHAVLSQLDALPKLYSELNRTYESRFADRIAGSVQGMVRILAAKDAGADARQLADAIVNRMRAMHDRHGVAVALKPPPAAKTTRKKKSV
jgi:hypothetical protein